MGYETRYGLEVNRAESDPVELQRFYEDANRGVTFGEYKMSLFVDEQPMKWYGYEKDMKELSESYPNVLFVLSGEGEESGDIWRAYFMNGDMQEVRAKITFDEPDVSKFKRVNLKDKRKAELSERRAALIAEQKKIEQELDNLTEV